MSGAVRLDVTLGGRGIDLGSLRESTEAAVTRLVASLGLPVEPMVSTEAAEHVSAAAAPPYSLTIGGGPARLNWSHSWQRPGDLPRRLEYDVVRNAALFITADVVEAVRARWADEGRASSLVALPPAELVDLLRQCVRLGRNVDRLFHGDPGSDERDPLTWRFLEAALDDEPSLSLVLPLWASESGPANAIAEALCDHVRTETGVLLPTPRVSGLDRAGDDDVVMTVCDVTSRTTLRRSHAGRHSLDEIAGVLAQALSEWLPAFVSRDVVAARVDNVASLLPRLVAGIRRRFAPAFLARAIRTLAAEGMAIGDLRVILSGLLEIRDATTADESHSIVFHAPAGIPTSQLAMSDGRLDPEDAADCVRRWARRTLTTQHWQAGTLKSQLLDPALESEFRSRGVRIASEVHRRFLEKLVGDTTPILTNTDVRRRVFDAIAFERPDVAVLGYQELLPETNVVPTRRVSA